MSRMLLKRILSSLKAAKINKTRLTIGFNFDGLKRFWLYKRLNEVFLIILEEYLLPEMFIFPVLREASIFKSY